MIIALWFITQHIQSPRGHWLTSRRLQVLKGDHIPLLNAFESDWTAGKELMMP